MIELAIVFAVLASIAIAIICRPGWTTDRSRIVLGVAAILAWTASELALLVPVPQGLVSEHEIFQPSLDASVPLPLIELAPGALW